MSTKKKKKSVEKYIGETFIYQKTNYTILKKDVRSYKKKTGQVVFVEQKQNKMNINKKIRFFSVICVKKGTFFVANGGKNNIRIIYIFILYKNIIYKNILGRR